MKTILLATLFATFSANAGLDLICTLASPAMDFQMQRDDESLVITNVLRDGGGRLDIEGLDGNVMEQPIIPEYSGFIDVGYSNECDNDYSFAIPRKALNELRDGNIATVNVLVEWVNSDSPMTEDEEVITQSAVLSCRKVQ